MLQGDDYANDPKSDAEKKTNTEALMYARAAALVRSLPWRLSSLSLLAGEKHLLLQAEPNAVRLGAYDTLQLQQQPLGGGSRDWTSEV